MMQKRILKIFGSNVRRHRKKKGFSQEELAQKAKVHRTYIGGIERGERNVSLMNVSRIANALGLNVTDLLK